MIEGPVQHSSGTHLRTRRGVVEAVGPLRRILGRVAGSRRAAAVAADAELGIVAVAPEGQESTKSTSFNRKRWASFRRVGRVLFRRGAQRRARLHDVSKARCSTPHNWCCPTRHDATRHTRLQPARSRGRGAGDEFDASSLDMVRRRGLGSMAPRLIHDDVSKAPCSPPHTARCRALGMREE